MVGDKAGRTKGDSPPRQVSFLIIFMHADVVDRALMFLGWLGAIGDGISFPVMNYLLSFLYNDIGSGPSTPHFAENICRYERLVLYTAVGSLLVSFLEGYCWTRTAERQASRMRTTYLRAVLRQDVEYFDLKVSSTTDVIAGVSEDSLIIQDFLSEKVPNFISNASGYLANLLVAFILMWRLTVVVFWTALVLIIPGLIYGRVQLGLARRIQMKYSEASNIVEQATSSIRTVYAFTAEHRIMSAFTSALEQAEKIGIQQGLAKGLAIGNNGIMFAIWAFMAWYSARLIIHKGVHGGNVLVASICIVNCGLCLGSCISNVQYFGEAVAASERMKEVIERRPPIDSESTDGEEIGELEGVVEFREVCFAYPARPDTEVLKRFSLVVAAGKTVALVGGSGSGKSTVITLLQRLYDPTGGEIQLDGLDIRKLRLKWLRAQMGFVSQDPSLFATSIKENILFGKEDATMEEVVAAANAANATAFISQLPQGYDTQVGERGAQLSGGQKQRIAIARAIIRSPKVLLLDEATSALDSISERLVQEAIDAAAAGRTTIIIAHRLSTIRNAHTIAFVEAGRVIESGSHHDLCHRPDTHYSSLVRLQEFHIPPNPHDATTSSALDACTSIPRSHSNSSSISNSIVSLPAISENPKQGKPPSFCRLLKLTAPEWRQAALGSIASVLVGAAQPTFAFLVGSIASVFFTKDHDDMKEKINSHAQLLTALSVLCFVANVFQHYNFAIMGERLTKRTRKLMLSKMLTFEVGWFDQDENSTGAICSRLSKDASVVRSLVADRMALVIQTMSAIAIAYTMGLWIAWRLALVVISVQPVVIICYFARYKILRSMSRKARDAQSESIGLAAEAVYNHRSIAAFSSQSRILGFFERAQAGPHREGVRQAWLAGAGLGLSICLPMCSNALAFWYGSQLVLYDHITAKDSFQTLLVLLFTGRVIAEAGAMTTDITKGVSGIASVFTILDRTTSIEPTNPEGHHPPESLNGDIELQNVVFSYPARLDVPVLRNFTLCIKANTSTALVGRSGSGKSTIISLIERFYDPSHGVVYMDGKDIRSYNLRSLRQHIALVGQDPVLFAGSVRENIAYGIDMSISDAEMEAVAKAATAHDFICGLQNGYETACGEHGLQLSGGQKQRIAIARAMLRNPRILLLDEATSALDGQSEKVVQEALERVMVGRTSVVVAHRLSTVKNCDVIAVIEDGVLVEIGNHSSLLLIGTTGKYHEFVGFLAKPNCTE